MTENVIDYNHVVEDKRWGTSYIMRWGTQLEVISIPMSIMLIINPLNTALLIGIFILIAMSPILVVITTCQCSSLHTHSSSKRSAASCYSRFQRVPHHYVRPLGPLPSYDHSLSHFSTEAVIVLLLYLSLYPAIQWERKWWRERKQKSGLEEVGVVYTPALVEEWKHTPITAMSRCSPLTILHRLCVCIYMTIYM